MNKLTNKELLKLISDRFEKNNKYWVIKWVDTILHRKLWVDIESIGTRFKFDNCTIITHYWFKTCNIDNISQGTSLIKEDDVSYFVFKTLLNNPSPKNYAK